MPDAQVIVVCSAVGCVALLVVVARAMGCRDRGWVALAVGLPLTLMLGIPRDLSGHTALVGAGLFAATVMFAFLGRIAGALDWIGWTFGALLIAFTVWLLYPLVLVSLVPISLIFVGVAALRIRRLRLADAMRPEGVQRRVALGGAVRGPTIDPPPHAEELNDVAWWAASVGDDVFVSGSLTLVSPDGPIVVEGAELTFDFEIAHQVWPEHTDGRQLLIDLGMPESEAARRNAQQTEDATAEEKHEPGTGRTYSVHWLPKETQIYVVGVPDWDRGPAELGGYRDAPRIPIFRNVAGRPHLVDRPISRARRDAWFDVFAWTTAAVGATAIVAYFRRLDIW